MTDTFWGGDDLHVGEDDVSKTLSLRRIVSLVRIIPDDGIPEDADTMRIG